MLMADFAKTSKNDENSDGSVVVVGKVVAASTTHGV